MIQKNPRHSLTRSFLQYELASVPLAFSDPDTSFSLCEAAKSELFKYLKKINSNSSSYTIKSIKNI